MLANIADVGDNLNLMGPQFAENRLQLIVAALGKGATSKTYLQGIGQLFDLLSGDAGYATNRTIANLINNQMPLAGLRNDMANIINPQMRELDADFWTHIRNRNPILKGTIAVKHDMLNGKPIRNWNPLEAGLGTISPIQLRLDKGPGRKLLFSSNYDMRIFAYTAPDGTRLRDHPRIRSMYQEALGLRNIEAKLNALSQRADVQNSINMMLEDRRNGKFGLDPMTAYLHNRLIRQLLNRESRAAWASIRTQPNVMNIINEQRTSKLNNLTRLNETRNVMSLPK